MTRSIAIAGKGGTGKSTIAALTVLYLRETGQTPILAIDADPDANLGTLLGVETEQTIGDLREDLRKEINNLPAGMSKAGYFEAGLHGIIEEEDGFDLITMGKGEGSGCYCSLNNMIRKFSDDLMPSYPWMVLDNEAGLEHISRRTTANIDALIVVVNDNPLSFKTAQSIVGLMKHLDSKIRRQYVVTNMISDKHKDQVLKKVSELPMEYLGDIPKDDKLQELIFSGHGLTELADSPARNSIRKFMEVIGERHGTA